MNPLYCHKHKSYSPRLATRPTRELGAVMVEGAISTLLVILLLFSIIDSSLLLYRVLITRNAVAEASRFAILGLTDPGDASRTISVEDRMLTYAARFGVSLRRQDLHICKAEDTTTCATNDAAGPQRLIMLSAGVPVRFFGFNLGTRMFNASAVVKNEPFA